MQVLPTLPIGAERHMWGTGPAAGGRFFLWAPNEVEEGGGPASALSARGGPQHRAHSANDVTNATSVDGDSVRDAGDLCSQSESAFGASLHAPSVQSHGSAPNSPVREQGFCCCYWFFCCLLQGFVLIAGRLYLSWLVENAQGIAVSATYTRQESLGCRGRRGSQEHCRKQARPVCPRHESDPSLPT